MSFADITHNIMDRKLFLYKYFIINFMKKAPDQHIFNI